ncbi:FGGY-family carbohydrate kinase [Neoaquamicrobium sediminum]|uniref:FGGY-family carbohydrate kinase n=1 Tax=Neoaquamicrobium sediminum TaxID=1849104 RepID=UPI003BA85039
MTPLAIGIDLGTSGARAVAMTPAFDIVAQGASSLTDHGADARDPGVWWRAVEAALEQVLAVVEPSSVRAIAVDGTSGTLLPVDADGTPLARPLMYSDKVEDEGLLVRIAPVIARDSAAHGATSGLAKALVFQDTDGIAKVLHQADWIAGQLSGRFDTTDENNALKTGYDPVAKRWPEWIAATGLRPELLPRVVAPGTPICVIAPATAVRFGLTEDVTIVAGTTDGCASFVATGASEPGDGVTVLGSTLTLKLLCDQPVFAPEFGVYSHRINGLWLAGGASNTGGRVLARYFTGDEIARLSEGIDPQEESALDYYPLLGPGERFPVMDANLQPRLEPRPASDAAFLKGILEGIAAIEKRGYDRLADLGAPALRSVRSVGGGAGNAAWTAIRQRRLGVPFLQAHSEQAAAGAARLALKGLEQVREPA